MAAKRAQKKAAPAASGGSKTPAANDKVGQIQRLIEVMVQAGAVEVELEEAGARLRVRLKEDRPTVYAAPTALAMPPAAPMPMVSGGGAAPAATGSKEISGEVFKSPMLGTFYRAASPESEPFVKPGDRASAETTLCIIEAMKVMNEIKAEREFEVLEVLVRNGDPVEFGQPLFVIRS